MPRGCWEHGEIVAEHRETYGLETILSVEEAARFMQVNPKTLYEAIKAGDVPGKRVGRRIVILRDALLDWLWASERVPPPRLGGKR